MNDKEVDSTQILKDLIDEEHADSDDIYEVHQLEQRYLNCEKYPYVRDEELVPPAVKRRLLKREQTLWLENGSLLKAATSSPEAWYALVLPSVSRQSGKLEEILANHLNEEIPGLNVKTLPNAGKNSIFLRYGEIVKRPDLHRNFTSSNKSLDLIAEDAKILFVAKRTSDEGGSQDNQYREAKQYIHQQTADSEYRLVLVLDGEYYQRKRDGETRLESVNREIAEKGLTHNTFAGDYRAVRGKLLEWISQDEEELTQ